MANAYGVDLRERAVRAYQRGEGALREVATTCSVDPRTLQRWIAHERATGSLNPKPKVGGWRCPIDLPLLHAVIATAPDATLAELCWEYNRWGPAAAADDRHELSPGHALRGVRAQETAAAE